MNCEAAEGAEISRRDADGVASAVIEVPAQGQGINTFQGLLDVPPRGIGMYFLPSEKDPVGAGRRLLKQHLRSCRLETYDLKIVPKNAPRNMTRQRLVFSAE